MYKPSDNIHLYLNISQYKIIANFSDFENILQMYKMTLNSIFELHAVITVILFFERSCTKR